MFWNILNDGDSRVSENHYDERFMTYRTVNLPTQRLVKRGLHNRCKKVQLSVK